MPGTLPAGPFETLSIAGAPVPSYVLPFDKSGAPLAPLTERHLLDAARDATDIYLFSHGWNNDWDAAVRFYRSFVSKYDSLVRAQGPARPDAKSIFVGVFWPSIWMPGSQAPDMAGGPGGEAADADVSGVQALAEEILPAADRAEFYALAQQPRLTEAEARRLAELLRPLYGRPDELGEPGAEPGVDDILRLWRDLREAFDEEESGPVIVSGPSGPAEPAGDEDGPVAAGLPAFLDPRNIVRVGTVLLMKDRAGVVGAHGVHRLLDGLLRGSSARLHLVGHSYGCRVVLSALCGGALTRPVRSVLLLQPALSYLAFAERLPDSGAAGGYRSALSRAEQPVMVTWTRRDVPLRRLFQLAVRRPTDLGDQNIGAAGLEKPSSKFAAMGGWGPQAAAEVFNENIRRPADGRYTNAPGIRVHALESHSVIGDHSDVVQDATVWALYNLAAG